MKLLRLQCFDPHRTLHDPSWKHLSHPCKQNKPLRLRRVWKATCADTPITMSAGYRVRAKKKKKEKNLPCYWRRRSLPALVKVLGCKLRSVLPPMQRSPLYPQQQTAWYAALVIKLHCTLLWLAYTNQDFPFITQTVYIVYMISPELGLLLALMQSCWVNHQQD